MFEAAREGPAARAWRTSQGSRQYKARIVLLAIPVLLRQNVTCGDSPRGMMSRPGIDGPVLDRDQ